jgi:lyso-ornithine lipid O-acyltransferase
MSERRAFHETLQRVLHGAVRGPARAAALVGVTATLLPGLVAHAHWVQRWSRTLLETFDIDVVLASAVPAPSESARGRLFVANHSSAIDVGLILALVGGRMVSRGDIASWPLIGAAAKAAGTLFVERGDAKSGANVIRLMRLALSEGDTVVVFPEGTTFEGDEVRPFRAGAFVAATGLDVEVVPVGLAYETGSQVAYVGQSFLQHLKAVGQSRATRVAVRFGTPLDARDTRPTELLDQAHFGVQACVAHARAHMLKLERDAPLRNPLATADKM